MYVNAPRHGCWIAAASALSFRYRMQNVVMFKPFVGDLFQARAQTLVNTVNCVGVMGKGLALEFKKRFPANFEDYAKRCEHQHVRLGEPYLLRSARSCMASFISCPSRSRSTRLTGCPRTWLMARP